MAWRSNRVFSDIDDFIQWLDRNYGSYISKHISEQHTHHTWRPNHDTNRRYSTLQLHKNMKNFHVNTNGWADIAQHVTIGSDGKVVLGRSITRTPVSALNYNGSSNWHPFAFEMIGNFDKGNDKLEGDQLNAAIKISRYFHKKGKDIKFHRELLINGRQPKTCPGTGISKSWYMNLVKSSKFDVGGTGAGGASSSNSSGSSNTDRNEGSQNFLEKGDSGSKVKSAQELLQKLGYSLPKYGADGDYGSETISAVKEMQKDLGITIDGLWGSETQEAAATALGKKNNDWYDKPEEEVKELQNLLIKVGYDLPKYGADGVFGDETLEAVQEFQVDNGISGIYGEYYGVAGPSTMKALKQKSEEIDKEPKVTEVSTNSKGKRVESTYNGRLNFYSKPDWDADPAGTVKKGHGFPKILRKLQVDGGHMYEVVNSNGDKFYITASSTYVKVVSNQPSYVGKRVESIYNGKLNFYGSRTWDSPVGTVRKGSGFPEIVDKHKVGGGYQYEVKNSKGDTYYITASSKYVKVVD